MVVNSRFKAFYNVFFVCFVEYAAAGLTLLIWKLLNPTPSEIIAVDFFF